ncbi:MAG TPA: radical SAM protein, partial [Thioalkalivibrio sp.]|nr:radical SAM protein [Thioalkalivibrio sp.]
MKDFDQASKTRGLRGRGATQQPAARYESTRSEPVDDGWHRDDEDLPPLRTHVTEERPRRVISENQSPDVP